ncbi:hypothetical protein B0H16DRAFT_1694658 [Mycena metata]|uniref:F-box domain-containing protein n=1 Tax=Mycena metata TaxID=1033252 RepID=A0AAD7IBB8_9AGAR|nr:hypothetical protein B0H16DRAFT_1694658 [Mycena metata]
MVIDSSLLPRRSTLAMRLRFTALRQVLRTSTTVRRADPRTIFPVEIWDIILNFLPDSTLLQTACVCRTFNELSIAMHLGRNGLNMGTESLTMHSHHLKALNLSCVTSAARSLVCNFWAFDVLRDLRCLLRVLKKSPNLTDVTLDWGHNLFQVHIFDNQRPYSSRSLLTTFLDVLSVLAHKTPGPVIVVAGSVICKVQPEDILRWELGNWGDTYRRFGRYRSKIRATIGSGSKTYSFFVIPLKDNGRTSFLLSPIHTVHVYSIRTQSETFSQFTLMAFPTTTLRLAATEAIPAAALSTILPHITAPFLSLLDILADTIDPGALSEFVGRHQGIMNIRFIRDADDVQSFANAKTLCRPPMILPRLTSLDASDGFGLIALLDAFDSPSVSTLSINCPPRHTAGHIVGLKSALRRISLRGRPTTLTLSLHVPSWWPPPDTIPIGEEERTIVGTAYCIERVRVQNCTFDEARVLLPWLAMLPALRRVELASVTLGSSWTADAQTQSDDFVRDATTALPSSVELEVERWRL